jgi:ribosomal-protein-alanine N-acetyltransferase
MSYQIANKRGRNEVFAIETERLRLSVLRKSDAQRVADYFIKNRDFHREFAQTHPDSYFTLPEQKEFLAYDCDSFLDGTLVPLWITLKDGKEIIGRVSFFNLAYGGMMSCSVGYHLDEEETGKGYMTEALTEARRMIMDVMHIHRIESFILPDDEKSLAVIKRCGFTHEGRRVSYMHINGKWEDHEAFYLLAPLEKN